MGGCGGTLYTGEVLSNTRRWLRVRLNLRGSALTPPHLLRLQWRSRRARGTSGRQARRQASTTVTSERADKRASEQDSEAARHGLHDNKAVPTVSWAAPSWRQPGPARHRVSMEGSTVVSPTGPTPADRRCPGGAPSQ